jgi:hypothetical protein
MVQQSDPDMGRALAEVLRRLDAVENGSPLQSASVTKGRVRIGGTAILLVDSSGGVIINGTLTGEGTIDWSQTAVFRGNFTAIGPTRLEGDVVVTKTLEVFADSFFREDVVILKTLDVQASTRLRGTTTLENDFSVTAGGVIRLGDMQLLPGGGESGGRLYSSGTIDLHAPIVKVRQELQVIDSLRVFGVTRLPGAAPISAAANVHINSTTGLISEVTSASKFKTDVRPLELPDSLLDIPIVDWLDAGEVERGEADTRIPGVIAESVEEAGGEQFVTYLDDEVHGVSYDRLALARTAVLARKLEAALKRIDELEAQVGRTS